MRECAVKFVQLSTVTWFPSKVCLVKFVGLSVQCANDIVQVIQADHYDYRNLCSHENRASHTKLEVRTTIIANGKVEITARAQKCAIPECDLFTLLVGHLEVAISCG